MRASTALVICLACSTEPAPRPAPEPPPEPSPVRAIAIDVGAEGCAVLEGGRVACWPLDGAPIASLVPDIAGAVEVAHGCARTERGALSCWRESTPVGLPAIARLDLGCAVGEDASVWCWGGALRLRWDEPSADDDVRARAVLGVDAVDVSCSLLRQCIAAARDGRAWSFSTLSGDDGPYETLPVVLEGLPRTLSVATGTTEACMRHERAITCSGLGTRGERVEIALAARDLAVGTLACAITEARGVACWGLGEGGYDATPRTIEGLSDVVEIAAGGAHACARREDGSVWCWDQRTPDRRQRVIWTQD